MVHFEFGQDGLTQPQPLNAFELAPGAIEIPFEAQLHHSWGTLMPHLVWLGKSLAVLPVSRSACGHASQPSLVSFFVQRLVVKVLKA